MAADHVNTPQTHDVASGRQREFHFIDVSNTDRTCLALARRHAMKGKNSGRKLHRRRSKPGARGGPDIPEYAYRYDSQHGTKNYTARQHRVTYPIDMAHHLGNILVTFPFPIELTPGSLHIISTCKMEMQCVFTPPRYTLEYNLLIW
jgi:hypothetical protein